MSKIEWITRSANAKKTLDSPPGWGSNPFRRRGVSNTIPASGGVDLGTKLVEGTERAYGLRAWPKVGTRGL